MGLAIEGRTVMYHRPMKTRSWVMALVLVAGCKGDSGKSLEPAVFGKAVAPPGDLAKIKIGMPVPEARKAAGSLVPEDKDSYKTTASPYSGMKYGVGVDEDTGKID